MKKLFFILICGILAGCTLSLVAAELIERSSGKEFCASCHTMQVPAAAYLADIHGGNNRVAFKAQCVDCHLPHDNVFHYMAAKVYTGTKDILGEMFWAKSVDWVANLQNRQKFTYTSGCLKCHDLKTMHYDIPKAFLAHKAFLSGKVTSCLQCHRGVGHKDIREALVSQK
jgi:cytochrome c-type protein NapC